jgi:DinB family protein
MGKQVDELVEMLVSSLGETLAVLSHLSDAELDDPSNHPCAMGGSVRDLLAHNIDHEQMHAGQVYSLRYSMRKMQKGQVDRLMAETIRVRANLIAALIGLDDIDLDALTPTDDWSIRQVVEHTLYWERHSIDDLAENKLKPRLPSDRPRSSWDVADPLEGKLARADEAASAGGNRQE